MWLLYSVTALQSVGTGIAAKIQCMTQSVNPVMNHILLQVMRMAKEAMISEFGQTPAQLFDENQPHPPRKVFQKVPKDPLPGYCSFTSQSPEISHTLVHTLLEVSASDSMHSVLSSPQPKPQRAASLNSAISAPSPLSALDQDHSRSGSDSRGPTSSSSATAVNPESHGVCFFLHRSTCSTSTL